MKYTFILLAFFLFACDTHILPEEEPTTTDPIIRARELNDSAIDLFAKDQRYGDNALQIFEDALALDSSYDKPYINKIAVLMQLRRFDQAHIASEALRKMRPTDADLLVLTGILFRLDGDSANSIEYFNTAVPMYQNSMNNLDSTAPVYLAERNKLALTYWLLNRPEETERLAPGMTQEERPSDEQLAAELWINLRPEETSVTYD